MATDTQQATSATEYLLELMEEEGGKDFWADVLSVGSAELEAFGTQLPPWLIASATEALEEVFGYDFWLDVPRVTRDSVQRTLEDGIERPAIIFDAEHLPPANARIVAQYTNGSGSPDGYCKDAQE